MSDGIAPANPVVNHTQSVERIGSDATGTETAAESFTRFLEEEDRPDPQSRPARRANAEKRERKADGDGAGTADEGQGRERQPKRERSERRQEGEPEGENPDEVDPLHDPVLDGDAPEEDGENPDDDTDAEGDEPDADADDENEDDEGDEDPEFEVTVNGEKQTVKQSELLASYSREADYRQKTEVLARDVEQVHEFADALTERRTHVDGLVQMAEDLLAAILPKDEDWQALRQRDPNAFIMAQEQWQGFINQATQLRQARDAQNGQQSEENTAKTNRYIKEENRKLFEAVPALRNPKVQKQFSQKIFAYGKRMGYTPDELAKGLVNHRDVQTAYFAARYLEILDSRKANAKKAATKAPRASEGNSAPRTPQSQRGRDNSRRMNRQREADRELQRTGSLQSAGNAFRAMMME